MTESGVEIAGVGIDYAGLAVRRHLGPERAEEVGAGINHFVGECKALIAQRFNCVVWIVHQLKIEADQRLPGAPLHHRDASETRHFGDHLDGCLIMGEHDSSNRCFVVSCTKSTAATAAPEPVIVRIDPDFATLVEVPDARVDQSTRRIITGPEEGQLDVPPDVLEALLASRRRDSE